MRRGTIWSSCTSVTRAKKQLLRWDRYARRCEKVAGPESPATPGLLKAHNRWARAVNYRNDPRRNP